MSTPRSVSHARSSSSSRVHSSCASSDSTNPARRHGRFRSISCPRNAGDRRSEGVERDLLEHRLDPVHRVAEVGVRLVPLEHRELGLVLVRDALVAEVLADLVDALEPADDETLQVELGRDPEKEVGLELVRVRHEGMRERAAVAGLQHRRLHLDEAFGVEIAPDRRDDLRAQEEQLSRLLVHQEVEVALAVARLRVGQTVERVRERPRVAREHRQLVDGERGLAAPRLRRTSAGSDDVAEVNVDVARASRIAHELDAPGAVDEVEEDELPHLAPRHDAAREPHRPVELGAGLEILGRGANVGDRDAIGKALRRHQGETLSGCAGRSPRVRSARRTSRRGSPSGRSAGCA